MRSDYFRAMLKGGMKESREKVITIEDIDEATFRSVLEFLYTGSVGVTGTICLLSTSFFVPSFHVI